MANQGNSPAGANIPPAPVNSPAGTNIPKNNIPKTNIPKTNNARVLGKNNRNKVGAKVGSKDNIQKFVSQNGLLIGVIVVVIVSMGAYY